MFPATHSIQPLNVSNTGIKVFLNISITYFFGVLSLPTSKKIRCFYYSSEAYRVATYCRSSGHHSTYIVGVKKYRIRKIERPSAHRTLYGIVCTSAFCQGHALLRVCLWKGDSLLWGTANVLTPS